MLRILQYFWQLVVVGLNSYIFLHISIFWVAVHFTVCICLSTATDSEVLQVKGSCRGIHDSGCWLSCRGCLFLWVWKSELTANIKKIYFTSELFFMDIGKTLTLLMLAGAGVTEILVHSYCLLSQEDCESRMLNFRVHMESSVCLSWDTPLYICRFSLLSPELMPPTQFFIPESLQCIATCRSSAYLCSTFTWCTLEGLSHLVWYGPFPTNGCRNVDLIITMNLLCIYEGFICICDLLANCWLF